MGKRKNRLSSAAQLRLAWTEQDEDFTSAPAIPAYFSRRARPQVSPVFGTYWRFAKNRQDIYFARVFGERPSLTVRDQILQRYRFTNVYRASDRVSQYLIRHVLYNQPHSPADLVFRLLVFKFFNKVETWEILSKDLGNISWETFDLRRYEQSLSRAMARGETIYSAAYIMPSGQTAFGFDRKHKNHLRIIESMMKENVVERITEQKNFQSMYRLLRQFPCVGPFVGYQLAIDLNYTALLDFSENEFVEPGPGALDGIRKCFTGIGD